MEIRSAIPFGQYVPRDSALHRLDPRTKILAVGVLSVALFATGSFAGLGALAAALVGLLMVGRIPLGFATRGLRPLAFLLSLTVVLNAFFTGGEGTTPVVTLGPLVATAEGLRAGAVAAGRLLLLVGLASLLTFTTSSVELADGIEWLLRPLRRVGVPGHELAMMTTIALRFVPTLLEETERILKAQAARGAEFGEGHLLRRAQALVPVMVPLLLSAFRRSEELALAMEARCYMAGAPRTRMRELRWRVADAVAGALVLAGAALLLRLT